MRRVAVSMMAHMRVAFALVISSAAIYKAISDNLSSLPKSAVIPLAGLLIACMWMANNLVLCGELLKSRVRGMNAPNPLSIAVRMSIILISVIYVISGHDLFFNHVIVYAAIYAVVTFDASGEMSQLAWKYRLKAFRKFPDDARADPYQIRDVEVAMMAIIIAIPLMSLIARMIWESSW